MLKILPANSGSKMIYLHFLHVEMNILLLLPVSIKILNIIDALCFKYIENNKVLFFLCQIILDNLIHQLSLLNFKFP